jgi:ferredoxin
VFKRCLRVFDQQGRFSPEFDETELSTIEADTLILSVGQNVSFEFIEEARDGISLTERGFVDADPDTGQCRSAPDIFVAGDCALGPGLAIHAIATGKRSARGIFNYLTGKSLTQREIEAHVELRGYSREAEYETTPRLEIPALDASERRASVSKPVELSFSTEAAEREAGRCLDCGVNTIFDGTKCILCGGCVDVCPTYCLKLVPVEEISGDFVEEVVTQLSREDAEVLSAIIKDEERCLRCALCFERCPTGAISMERFVFQEVWFDRQADSA